METTFENAQVGDKVWDEHTQEYGDIYSIQEGILHVNFKNFSKCYAASGKIVGCAIRTLYWEKLEIPERPKRKIKKVIEGWINFYPPYSVGGFIYATEKNADDNKRPERIGKAHFIHHEYEVDE